MSLTAAERALSISPNAVRRLTELAAGEGRPGVKLRVSVSGGGCSGFQYGFTLDDARTDDDLVFERGGVAVIVDGASLDLLAGAEIDFVEDLAGSSFQIRNPNAVSSCGCGNSFAV